MDDAALVQLYWDRDERAIPATADKYGNYCTSIAQNILGNREDAEECVNDTYFNAWNAMPPHRPSVLSTFLGKITRNLSIKRRSYHTADKRGGGQATVVLDEIAELVSDTDGVEQELDRRERVRRNSSAEAPASSRLLRGKQAKRCLWQRKRACFKEAARLAATDSGRETPCRDEGKRTASLWKPTRERLFWGTRTRFPGRLPIFR